MIVLNKSNSIPLYLQVYEAFKRDIINQTLASGTKLPSIRALATQIDVSVKTIQNAYDQLLMEGYIDSRERSGYFVMEIESPVKSKKSAEQIMIKNIAYKNTGITHEAFDENIWRKTINKVLASIDLTTLSHINGEDELKKEIIKFATDYRGIDAHYNQVIIGSSTQVLLTRLMAIIDNVTVAYETPGYNKAAEIFKQYANIQPITATSKGLTTDKLKGANVVYLSPSHQYPFGTIMSINERLKMLEWAENKYIIEDDYNSVLRYQGNPIPSLQGLDQNGSVIYFGSFSNLMYPSINISYMILPKQLLEKHEESKDNYTQTVSKLDQLTLAKYMQDGHFERHLRRIKKLYSKKSELIQNELLKKNINIVESSAGTHIVLEHHNVDEIIKTAKKKNILLEKISKQFLLFRYRGLEDRDIPTIIESIF